MMECSEVEALIDDWENGRDVSMDLFAVLKGHLAECTTCAGRFAALVPLMERDVGATPFVQLPARADALRPVFAARERRVARSSLRWLTVAAAALFFLGIGLGLVLARSAKGDEVVIRFSLEAPQAKTVSIVGDFNRWNPGSAVMTRRGTDSPWELSLKLTKGHIYAYNFLIDGTLWVVDPRAVEEIQDGFGGSNSLLRL